MPLYGPLRCPQGLPYGHRGKGGELQYTRKGQGTREVVGVGWGGFWEDMNSTESRISMENNGRIQGNRLTGSRDEKITSGAEWGGLKFSTGNNISQTPSTSARRKGVQLQSWVGGGYI